MRQRHGSTMYKVIVGLVVCALLSIIGVVAINMLMRKKPYQSSVTTEMQAFSPEQEEQPSAPSGSETGSEIASIARASIPTATQEAAPQEPAQISTTTPQTVNANPDENQPQPQPQFDPVAEEQSPDPEYVAYYQEMYSEYQQRESGVLANLETSRQQCLQAQRTCDTQLEQHRQGLEPSYSQGEAWAIARFESYKVELNGYMEDVWAKHRQYESEIDAYIEQLWEEFNRFYPLP